MSDFEERWERKAKIMLGDFVSLHSRPTFKFKVTAISHDRSAIQIEYGGDLLWKGIHEILDVERKANIRVKP